MKEPTDKETLAAFERVLKLLNSPAEEDKTKVGEHGIRYSKDKVLKVKDMSINQVIAFKDICIKEVIILKEKLSVHDKVPKNSEP